MITSLHHLPDSVELTMVGRVPVQYYIHAISVSVSDQAGGGHQAHETLEFQRIGGGRDHIRRLGMAIGNGQEDGDAL